jgi:hypothetical protein
LLYVGLFSHSARCVALIESDKRRPPQNMIPTILGTDHIGDRSDIGKKQWGQIE